MTALRRGLATLVWCALGVANVRLAAAQVLSQAAMDAGACPVRVAGVVARDATGTLQAIVLESTATESAILSGSLAVFTESNLRYELRFENAAIGPTAPGVLVYRFPARVTLTGAYVAALDSTSPPACAIVDPWSAGAAIEPLAERAIADAAVAGAGPPPALVTGLVQADPLTCHALATPARVRTEAAPDLTFITGAPPEGAVTIGVLVAADGRPLDVHVDRVDGTIDESSAASAIRSTALSAAMKSTYVAATFRCRPILGMGTYHIAYGHHR